MTHTVALSSEYAATGNHAEPHTIADGRLFRIPVAQIDNLAPAGSIGSSVSDLSHWVLMQLNDGKYEGKQVVPADAIAQTRTPHSIIGNGGTLYNKGHFELYGLGWGLEEYCGRKVVSHTGGVNGFVTSVTLVPEEKLGIIVLTNTDQNAFYEALKWEIMDACLKNEYRNYSGVYRTFMSMRETKEIAMDKAYKDTIAMKKPTTLSLSAYAGNYFNDLYGDMKVVQEAGELRMRFSHHPNMYAKLEPLGGDRFHATFSDPIFSKAIFPFTVKNGKVTGVTVKVADFVEATPYEFVRK
jgi:CubicO group peptidase (beta-lactamase class C family)